MRPETSQEIDAAAASWAARLESGTVSVKDDEQFEQWLAADSRHRGAFMRMRAFALHSDRAKALGSSYDPEQFGGNDLERSIRLRSPTRRRALAFGGSAIAASIAGLFAVTMLPLSTTYESALGQVRVVTLEDGSVMTLNTDSEVHVRYSEDQRFISLDRGEVLFDVAKNAVRPFVVDADGTAVTAIGTSFIVKKLASEPVEILVQEGVVEVVRKAARSPVRMTANSKLVSSTTPAAITPVKLPPEEVARELAWKSGRLSFEGETLADAAGAFERYSETRIIIEDPAIGREEITGLFASNDPVGFAKAAALSLDLQTKVGPNEVRISRN